MKKIKNIIDDGDVDEEGAKKVAAQWMTIADVDGDGMIDFQEFKDFMAKIEDEAEDKTTDEQLKEIFDSIDENNNGQLDVDEFGKAFF
jgi:Ca2+-binding EF-hand superfamily protein